MRTMRDAPGAPAAVLAAYRVDGGWSGDSWAGQDSKVVETECVLGTIGADSNASQLVAVPFHHFSLDGSGRRLTLFWNGYAFSEPGPVWADERDDGVIVTVTERRAAGALATAGEGRRSAVQLRAPIGDRPAWDRRPGRLGRTRSRRTGVPPGCCAGGSQCERRNAGLSGRRAPAGSGFSLFQ
jgi:hypothetical protein